MARRKKNTSCKKPNTGYVFRLYPTPDQENFLSKEFGCARLVYNHFLDKTQQTYANTKKHTNYQNNAKLLTKLKQTEEFSFLNNVNSQSLQASIENLDKGYQAFFNYIKNPKGKRKVGLPQFKKKHKSEDKVKIPSGFYLEGIKSNYFLDKEVFDYPTKLYIPKLKTGIPINIHREIKGDIVALNISRNKAGQYHASFQVMETFAKLPVVNKAIGIDLGIKSFVYDSNGNDIQNPRHLKTSRKALRKAQKKLSRRLEAKKQRDCCGKGKECTEHKNTNINKARENFAKKHLKVTNQRKDFQHKLSKQIIDENQVICLETLMVSGMLKNRKLAKSIQDCGWSQFVRFLVYKAERYGRTIVKIDQWFPSSKQCNDCGHTNKQLTLKDREWVCESCGVSHVRDWNAAKNILEEGLRLLVEKTGVGYPSVYKEKLVESLVTVLCLEQDKSMAVKQEAHRLS